ncbi:MAG TPA: DUF3866 family protein [Syntrophomonadaceae bacterium]|nr:DUF3866 family protein [Syntrophomonadaceae bacterium]
MEIKRGTILRELFSRPGIKGYLAEVDGREEECIAYPDLLEDVQTGSTVLLNTTAVSLQLGSGGYHFIIAVLDGQGRSLSGEGHIMKLRYTPLQLKVLSVEEPASPYHDLIMKTDNLQGTPVLAATLHSMLAPLCLYPHRKGLRVAYVMTDGAALPLAFSRTVAELSERGMICGTVTCGHAFGGDLEAVNIYSGLLAAHAVWNPDLIIVAMGPGIVGTGTRWGFSGIEQGEILNAVDTLQGVPIVVPRISFADSRSRHRGLSHHTMTVLSRVCRVSAFLPLPRLDEAKNTVILEQLWKDNLLERYRACMLEGLPILDMIAESGLKVKTMGRGVMEDREFFLALGAAARAAVSIKDGEELPRVFLV